LDEIISLAYGNGGKKTSELINELLLPYINNEYLGTLGDGAILNIKNRLAFSTDSFVIDPYIFPGGDIGKLSVCGTVNDLLMCGSIPRFLSLAFIIEEGFKLKDLETIIKSIAETCKSAGVKIVTGDTKVVDKGHGHGIYINTSGIGELVEGVKLSKERIVPGDKVILTGSCGNHGISILCKREEFLESDILSDCACLNQIVYEILNFKEQVRILRDPTRGGIATTLNEFVEGSNMSIELNSESIPIDGEVEAACKLLGLDPLYSANEGKALAIVQADVADELVEKLRKIPQSHNAAVIGEVVDYAEGKVIIKNPFGGKRILDKLSQDILPRIC
jgi:hydrogenase expression/formation protein HypE